VRSHIKSIYAKLDVRDRAHALEKARALTLYSDYLLSAIAPTGTIGR